MLAENFAEQGGGRRNTYVFRGRQRSYAEFNATDVKGFYWILVLFFISRTIRYSIRQKGSIL